MLRDVIVVSFGFEEGMNYGRYSFRGMNAGMGEKKGLMDACGGMED